MDIETGLLSAMLHFAVCAFLLSATLLCIRRYPNNKSRAYLAIAFFVTVISFGLRVFVGYAGRPLTYHVLPIANLYGGLIALMIYYLYPIEVIRPGWLNFKRGILFFAPWLLLNLFLACVTFHFRELASFGDMIGHIGEFNVWFRLLIIVIGIIPYSIMLFYIPYNYKTSSADCQWISTYTVAIQGVGIFYTLFMLTGSMTVSIIHVTYCILFCLFITYQELFLRINVPVTPREIPVESSVSSDIPVPLETLDTPDENITPEKNKENPLWLQLNELIDREQLWRNPDTNITKLAVLLDTNRNKLTRIIQEKGYDGYKEFINRRRIDEFLKIADSDKYVNVLDTFFKVGFRSKATALRNFKEYTGMLPSEYLQIKLKKKTKTP